VLQRFAVRKPAATPTIRRTLNQVYIDRTNVRTTLVEGDPAAVHSTLGPSVVFRTVFDNPPRPAAR